MQRSLAQREGRKVISPISDEQLKFIVHTCAVATRTCADAAAASALSRNAKVEEKTALERRKDQEDAMGACRDAGRQNVAALKRAAAVGFVSGTPAASTIEATEDNNHTAAADEAGLTSAGAKVAAAAAVQEDVAASR